MIKLIENNENLSGQSQGIFDSILGFGREAASLYSQGDAIWKSVPGNEEVEKEILSDVQPSKTVQTSVIANEQLKNTTAKSSSFFNENKNIIMIGGAALVGLVILGAVVRGMTK